MVIFDMYGKLILGKVNKKVKHNETTELTIKKDKKTESIFKPRLETYWCYKHNCFHKYKYRGKPSQTWIKCLNKNTNNFGGFKKDMTESQILAHLLPKSLKQYSIEGHKKTIGSKKQ